MAGLAILRAFHVAGRPNQGLPGWGGFEEWSEWIRGAIVWLGLPDPSYGRRKIEDLDPVRSRLGALYDVWGALLGTRPVTVSDVVKASQEAGNEALQAVLAESFSDRQGKISNRALGNFLSNNEKRIEQGLRVERAGTRQGAVLWKVVPMEGREFGEL